MKKFAEWMKHNDRKQLGVAKKIGVSQAHMHDIVRKGHIPSLKIAYEIEKYTLGAITLYDWVDQSAADNEENTKTENIVNTKNIPKTAKAQRKK